MHAKRLIERFITENKINARKVTYPVAHATNQPDAVVTTLKHSLGVFTMGHLQPRAFDSLLAWTESPSIRNLSPEPRAVVLCRSADWEQIERFGDEGIYVAVLHQNQLWELWGPTYDGSGW